MKSLTGMASEILALRQQISRLETKLDCLLQLLGNGYAEKKQPLDTRQAAAYLHLSVSRLYCLISEGKLKPMQKKKYGRILFTTEQLNEYLKTKEDECYQG